MRLAHRLCLQMKLAALVLALSAVSPNASRADEAGARSLQFAQMVQPKPEHQPAGACTPIGLTANGEIVFPWECREIIERQRGPVSVNLPTASTNDPPSKDRPAPPNARPQDAAVPMAPAQPVAATTADRASAGDHTSSPPDANAAALLAKPLLHQQRLSAVRHKDQPVAAQLRPASGAVIRTSSKETSNKDTSNKDPSNKDKFALQRGAPQK
jgi:hypothetical protein